MAYYKVHFVLCQGEEEKILNCPESLRQNRVSRHYTRQQLADLLGVSLRAYQTYETGTREPSLTALVKLADFYGVPLDLLVGREFPKNTLVDTE